MRAFDGQFTKVAPQDFQRCSATASYQIAWILANTSSYPNVTHCHAVSVPGGGQHSSGLPRRMFCGPINQPLGGLVAQVLIS